MDNDFYLPEDPDYTPVDSVRDSVRFAHRCLERIEGGKWRALSSFVDTEGQIMHWHDFGDLEGPGWAANAVGGAYQLYAWGRFDHHPILEHVAIGLLDHVLEDGFLQSDGFIIGYRDTASNAFFLNFKHNSDWFCPGSMAKIALQMLWMSDLLPKEDPRVARLRGYAPLTAKWLRTKLKTTGEWFPRRADFEGRPYLQSAEGGEEPLPYHSADSLYILWLLLELTKRGIADHARFVREKLNFLMDRGGIYGSINHDTYDHDENVARAETFRLLLSAYRFYREERMRLFAYENALAGLERFKMREDRNGVATRGLLYMEDSWDTAYLWENAEAALAYLEAYEDTLQREYLCDALTILRAIARHHYGDHGFLTEGVDWNNHVGQEHHINQAVFGAIRYTEPLLNNLHHLEPTLRYLQRHAVAGL